MHQIFEGLSTHTDREAAIVAHAVIEKSLERVLLAKFVPLDSSEREELFSGSSPLATFSTKLKLAYALGLLSPSARDALIITNEIRNVFAHSLERLSFETPELLPKMQNLKYDWEKEIYDPIYNFQFETIHDDTDSNKNEIEITDGDFNYIVYFRKVQFGDGNKGTFLWIAAQLWTILTQLRESTARSSPQRNDP